MTRLISRLWLVGFLSVVGSLAHAETQDWPQWQGPHRNCLTDATGLLQAWPADGPRRQWLFENCGTGYSGPAVVDGRLFIMGQRDGVCYLLALDADSGRELWATPVSDEYQNAWGSGPRGTPTIKDGLVYALSATGTLMCARADDGRETWRVTMESLGGSVPNWGYAESPLVDGDWVLCTPGGQAGAIAALDRNTGDVVWQAADLTDGAHYSSIVRGVFHGQPQYVQLLEKRLVGVAADDGRLLWEVAWPGNVAVIPTPIIHDDHVFVTSGYGAGCMLVQIDERNRATKVYENKLMKNHHGGVILLGDHLYGHSDGVGWLCLELRTGEQVWREREVLGKGAIGYADGRFYCLEEKEGVVALIDASPDGWQERGRLTLSPQSPDRSPKGGIWVHPVIVDGKLFLRDQQFLYCFDVRE